MPYHDQIYPMLWVSYFKYVLTILSNTCLSACYISKLHNKSTLRNLSVYTGFNKFKKTFLITDFLCFRRPSYGLPEALFSTSPSVCAYVGACPTEKFSDRLATLPVF